MDTEGKSPNIGSSMQRVKVYRLNEDGKWGDDGTGHVTVDHLEGSENMGLSVIDEDDDNKTLLSHRIRPDDIYRKQEDTIISWRDSEFSTELALSFQETTGCSYIWEQICTLQRNMHFVSLSNETFRNIDIQLKEFLPVELSNLPLILKTVVQRGNAGHLRVTELILHDQDFLRKLMQLFRTCEDLGNVDGLHLIFKIVRGIILLNSPQIFEKIFGDELMMDIVGCLEYDPEVPRVRHRNFLKEDVVFKEVIPIKDPVALSKIHQTYRVGYLKDVILPRALDEAIVANLNSIIHSNNAIVVSLLRDDNTFMKELFARLKSPTTSIESKKTLMHFLHEFCTSSKSLQLAHQVNLFRDLSSEGIFDIIADILRSEDKKLILAGTDILVLFMNLDSNILRSYVSRQEDVLFELLVKNMLIDFGGDMHCQSSEIIRNLLDQNTSGSQAILEIFFEKHLGQLIDAIPSSCPPNGDGQIDSKSVSSDEAQSRVTPEILLNICDLLCSCVSQHPYRIKSNFLDNNEIHKVLCLTRRKEKYLVLAAIRFMRTLISRGDEHLVNHVVQNNLFKPVVDAFVANKRRDNLLNSAVLELFEYILKQNLKVLLGYLVDTFWNQLAEFECFQSVRALKDKYEQSEESTGTKSTGSLLDKRKQTEEPGSEKDSGEEKPATTNTGHSPRPPVVDYRSLTNNPAPRFSGLVDYPDDEDDENYSPPPKKLKNASDKEESLEHCPKSLKPNAQTEIEADKEEAPPGFSKDEPMETDESKKHGGEIPLSPSVT